MSNEFIRRKIIWLELGITDVTLYKRINAGTYPRLQNEKEGSFKKGYFKETFDRVKQIKIAPKGRPRK